MYNEVRGRGHRHTALLLLLFTLVCLGVFLCFSWPLDKAYAQKQKENPPAQEEGQGQEQEKDQSPGTSVPELPRIDPNLNPKSWLTTKATLALGILWAVFTIVIVIAILWHSLRLAIGGAQMAIEAKAAIYRAIGAVVLGAAGWVITSLLIHFVQRGL